MNELIFGRLEWSSFFIHEFIAEPSIDSAVAAGAGLAVVLGALALLGVLIRYRLWDRAWRDWLTSVDHKKIGIMYIVLALVMMARGVAEGVVMRAHQATALDGGVLSAEHFAQLFSTHGTIMILFVAMPLLIGLINYVVPLQIGARDMVFPVMNQVSLGLTTAAAALIMVSLVVGHFETGGWSAYPPYTGADFNPGVGPDYWIWAIVLSGIGTTLTGINFAVTIYKSRAPGMHFMRMPMFTWTALCTAIMIVYGMPPLTVGSLMLALDRYLDFHFFTNDLGGNMMNYANIFWMFGHPEVYIVVLPSFGVFSEISATYAAKRLYGYASLVFATMAIAAVSFTVWLHHFFTMGQSASVNIAFGIATMVIAVPTGVKIYDWMATLYRGRIRLTAPMIYMLGFFFLFVIGGLSGVIQANPTVDFQVHNTLFLVAHFHNVLIPGTLFGLLAGIHYWFPKAFGFRLDERLAKRGAWLWIIGFCFTFLPLYWLGLLGMPRRSASFSDPAFVPWMLVTLAGALTLLGAFFTMLQTGWVSVRDRARLAVPIGDPWDGRTLEWSVPAPPREWNFAATPRVHSRDAFAVEKEAGHPYQPAQRYTDIEMPKATSMGMVVGVAGTLMGFGLIWHIWWLAMVGLLGMLASMVARGLVIDTQHTLSAAELEQAHRDWLTQVASTRAVTRDEETTPGNRGLAAADVVP
ncbi:cbb3-type cytochrome c oxidase subunit I [Halomonas garicola]|uniref:cbb3-type cytochrome c oxidase subunit I n=1 Tax=Halomonas garicola TaxID=1690008 RepID=UPI0028A1E2C0|nr:cbb3-type cytochrome c oxidase subunit I [Halomonas garicola]